MPGASFAPVAGTRAASPSTASNGGEYDRGSNVRPRPLRRAGSTKTPPAPVTSTSSTSAHRTSARPDRPAASTLARATSAVSGSRSTPMTCSPAAARARRSSPTPQQRSRTGRSDVGVPDGVPGGDGGPGRLLEPVVGEEEQVGQVAEPGAGPGAQPGLGQRGGHQAVVEPLAAQRGAQRQGSARGRTAGSRRQQAPPVGGQQCPERVELLGAHDRIIPAAR